jgi:hypothetical protein
MDTDALIADFAARIRSNQILPVLHPPFGLDRREEPEPEPEPQPRPALSEAQVSSVETMLMAAVASALHKMRRYGRTATDQIIREAMSNAVKEQCAAVLESANAQIAATKAKDKSREKAKEKRAKARKALADELRSARSRLRMLNTVIERSDEIAGKMVEEKARAHRKVWADRLRAAKSRLQRLKEAVDKEVMAISGTPVSFSGSYPDVPAPTITPDKDGIGLPSAPGIYFLWKGDKIDYVGKSIRLCNRLKLGSHHVLDVEHRISYILMCESELTWAECYYIGVARPVSNFGLMASHRQKAKE